LTGACCGRLLRPSATDEKTSAGKRIVIKTLERFSICEDLSLRSRNRPSWQPLLSGISDFNFIVAQNHMLAALSRQAQVALATVWQSTDDLL
jgi:hypothetical protein